MKRNQKGEVMLVVMIVMLAVIWLGRDHMGMMGHGTVHTEKSNAASQQDKAESHQSTVPKESLEHQY